MLVVAMAESLDWMRDGMMVARMAMMRAGWMVVVRAAA